MGPGPGLRVSARTAAVVLAIVSSGAGSRATPLVRNVSKSSMTPLVSSRSHASSVLSL